MQDTHTQDICKQSQLKEFVTIPHSGPGRIHNNKWFQKGKQTLIFQKWFGESSILCPLLSENRQTGHSSHSMIHREMAHSPTCAHRPQETCLTLGTIIRCCTIRVWQMEAILVKTSSLAESLHTRFNRVLVCCFVSSFLRHSSVMYGAETLPSS